jgi:hypothetical protein
MFGFTKKPSEQMQGAAIEMLIRQEGAFVALRRLIESGVVSREEVVKVWKQADKERRRHWKMTKPGVPILGPLIPESIIDNDDDDA